jgi:excisionase family DNA binding protein
MLTVPEAARRAGRNPETIRRWIREGRLRAGKVGTQHVIEAEDLDDVLRDAEPQLELPSAWERTSWGAPMPNTVRAVHRAREGR